MGSVLMVDLTNEAGLVVQEPVDGAG